MLALKSQSKVSPLPCQGTFLRLSNLLWQQLRYLQRTLFPVVGFFPFLDVPHRHIHVLCPPGDGPVQDAEPTPSFQPLPKPWQHPTEAGITSLPAVAAERCLAEVTQKRGALLRPWHIPALKHCLQPPASAQLALPATFPPGS